MRYYIIAGEASGDLHGSNLMRGLYKEDPEAGIRFWGGGFMDGVYHEHQQGEGLVMDYKAGAVMGFGGVLKQGFTLAKKLRLAKADIAAWKPDAVILIDYPGFNFRVAKFAHGAGFPVYYYIAPKVWATREGRIKKLKAWVDRLFIVFPFEIPYFKSKGVPFTYVGNPLVDAVDAAPAMKESREAFLQRTGLPDAPFIALLAGSRNGEISSMMPHFMEFADKWHAAHPSYHFVLAAAPSRTLDDYAKYLGNRDFVHVIFGDTYGALRHAEAAVINSGTASLEAAIIGTPQVVTYRIDAITYFLYKLMIKIPYVSLANLIVGREAFRELLQDDFTPENVFSEMERLTMDSAYRERMLSDYAEVRRLLGSAGASSTAAREMISALKH